MRWLWLALAWLLPAAADGQEAYTLTFKKAAKGTVTQASYLDVREERVQVTANGKVVAEAGKQNRTEAVWAFDEVVLERPDAGRKATALQRTYQKAEVRENDKPQTLPYQGKKVAITKKLDRYEFGIDGGGALGVADARYLDEEFNLGPDDLEWENALLPRQPVKVGDVWKIDTADAARVLEKNGQLKLDATRGTGTGKLLAVTTRNSYRLGELEFNLELPITSMKGKAGDIPLKAGAVVVVQLHTLMCIDGSVRYNIGDLSVRMSGSATPPDNPNLLIDFTLTRTRKGGESEVVKQ
jgi:hypothetical protein